MVCRNESLGIRRRLSTRTLIASSVMSHSYLTATSSSNFQLILNNALKAYQKLTKRDLLTHPLASSLQACDSPTAILVVLQQHVQGLDQSRSGDDRWTKWLDPTVKVVYVFSSTLEERVGLVSLSTRSCVYALSYTDVWQVLPPAKVILAGVGVLLSVRHP